MFKSTLAIGTLALFTLFSGTVPAFAADTTTASSPVSTTVAATTPLTINNEEANALKYMREEEKLAHDVYITLFNEWGLRVFSNIAASEQKHTDSIAALLSRYGVSDPTIGNGVGEFTNPDLQVLYDELIVQGATSVAAALKVGAAIEEIDIADLDERMAETASVDILRVYGNLKAGSENHLRAFAATLTSQTGAAYVPQYMDQATYDTIVSAGNSVQQGAGRRGGNSRRP